MWKTGDYANIGVVRQRLIRFIAADNRIYYGDAILPPGVSDAAKATKAKPIVGDIFSTSARVVENKVLDVKKLLAPLDMRDVRTVRCLGLNYAAHAKEVNIFVLSKNSKGLRNCVVNGGFRESSRICQFRNTQFCL